MWFQILLAASTHLLRASFYHNPFRHSLCISGRREKDRTLAFKAWIRGGGKKERGKKVGGCVEFRGEKRRGGGGGGGVVPCGGNQVGVSGSGRYAGAGAAVARS